MSPLVAVEELKTWFRVRSAGWFGQALNLKAVDDVTFTIARGEVLGLVGESGSGKTTVGRSLLRLIEPTSGAVRFEGRDVLGLKGRALKSFRREAQIVFQDPYSSLSPRMRVGRIIEEPLKVQHVIRSPRQRRDRAAELMETVGLAADQLDRFPHEFSGGQRQRIAIARALALNPKFVVADEPVSALDVSIQAQVVNLLKSLKKQFGLTMLFIAHDLAVVEYIADRIAVMYLGHVVEVAPTRRLIGMPYHPYTRALLSAVPVPDPTVERKRTVLAGDIPSPINPPTGCVFRTRCPYVLPDCARVTPRLTEVGPGHSKACIRDDI